MRPMFISKNAPHNTWQAKAKLYNHLPFGFFSDFNSTHNPLRPDQRWEGEIEDEFDGHVGPPIPIQYTRCPDFTIRVHRPTQPKTKPYIFPTLTWLVPDWDGKDDHKAHVRKESKRNPGTNIQTLPIFKIKPAYSRWVNANPVMIWPDPEQENKTDQEAQSWETRKGGPSKQLWQRPQIEHTPLIPTVPKTAWEGTSQGRTGAERGLILSPEPEPDLREGDLPMEDPPWRGPLVE